MLTAEQKQQANQWRMDGVSWRTIAARVNHEVYDLREKLDPNFADFRKKSLQSALGKAKAGIIRARYRKIVERKKPKRIMAAKPTKATPQVEIRQRPVSTQTSNPELVLWLAVVQQAIDDACSLGHDNSEIRYRNDARSWLLGDSKDFREVCTMALLDPDAVRESAQRLEAKGWPPRQKSGRRPVERRVAQKSNASG